MNWFRRLASSESTPQTSGGLNYMYEQWLSNPHDIGVCLDAVNALQQSFKEKAYELQVSQEWFGMLHHILSTPALLDTKLYLSVLSLLESFLRPLQGALLNPRGHCTGSTSGSPGTPTANEAPTGSSPPALPILSVETGKFWCNHASVFLSILIPLNTVSSREGFNCQLLAISCLINLLRCHTLHSTPSMGDYHSPPSPSSTSLQNTPSQSNNTPSGVSSIGVIPHSHHHHLHPLYSVEIPSWQGQWTIKVTQPLPLNNINNNHFLSIWPTPTVSQLLLIMHYLYSLHSMLDTLWMPFKTRARTAQRYSALWSPSF